MAKFVGIMAATGAGKSSIAREVADRLGCPVLAFADTLKVMATERGWSGLKDGPGRAQLQAISEEIKRELGEDIFLRTTLASAAAADTEFVILEDVRFSHEVIGIVNAGGILVHVGEPSAEARWYKATQEYSRGVDDAKWALHRSELEWRALLHLATARVTNDLSHGGFERTVKKFISHIEASR